MSGSKEFQYIDSPESLKTFCEKLSGCEWLALDTEFMREKTYFPVLCLIQVATLDHVACIDPIVIDDLTPLLDILYNRKIVKVLHACRQDMEIFFHIRGEVPAPVFDTQLAAPLLGYKEQIGYASLVEKVLGVSLGKAHSRADWARRPLTEAQCRYAADDVIYLAELYVHMQRALEEKGRLSWLEKDFDALSKSGLYENAPAQAWRRIRAARRLKGNQLAVLQVLAAWRETTACNSNRPRNWLVKDDVLVDIARMLPDTLETLSHIRGINERILQQYGEDLLAEIIKAKDKVPEKPMIKRKSDVLTPSQEAVVDVLMAVIRLRATDNSLHPSVLMSRKELEQILIQGIESVEMAAWKKNMLGDDIDAVMTGRRILRVVNGSLELIDYMA